MSWREDGDGRDLHQPDIVLIGLIRLIGPIRLIGLIGPISPISPIGLISPIGPIKEKLTLKK